MSIHSISLKNFKSIRETKEPIYFGDLTILIGANGAGKSNLISFFKLLDTIMNKNLHDEVIAQSGKADRFLYFGAKQSSFLEGTIEFTNDYHGVAYNAYRFKLVPTQDGRLVFDSDESGFLKENGWDWKTITKNRAEESSLPDNSEHRNEWYLKPFFKNFRVFHFNDTSSTAAVKRFCNVNDNRYLREDAGNLAAFLYRLSQSHPKHFNIIEKIIQSVAPFFDRFDLLPDHVGDINLKWLEKGSDAFRDAHYLSDGTLRFICLTTLLLQPELPPTIIIDEPELGLHPFAIEKLAGMIDSVISMGETQIIISTQSVNLLNNFNYSDVIVVEREGDQSVFKSLKDEKLEEWLEDYTLGELWNKNIIGGRP